jgi:hypothetical protein
MGASIHSLIADGSSKSPGFDNVETMDLLGAGLTIQKKNQSLVVVVVG